MNTKRGPSHPIRMLIVVLLFSPLMLIFVGRVYAQVDLPPIGGVGGGWFRAPCAAGRLLTGVEIRVGDDVDNIRPICAVAYGPEQVGAREIYPTKFGGDGGGENRQLICPRNAPVVGGMYINAEGVRTVTVNNIHLFCGAASATQTLSQYPSASFDGRKAKPDEGLFGLDTDGVQLDYGSQQCPAGLVGVGIRGRAGIWLDALGLICGAPTLTHAPVKAQGRVKVEPQGPVVKAQGRVKLDPGAPPSPRRPICDVAKTARDRKSPAAHGLEQQCRAELVAQLAAGPAIIVSEALGTDPATVYLAGQTQRTATVRWNAAPAYTYCEIYLSINNGEWTELGRGRDGTKPLTITLGTSYTLRMMVYEGQAGTPKVIKLINLNAAP